MQTLMIIAVVIHVLSSVFWAGSTFVLARTGGADAARLFRPQIGAALAATASGALLWNLFHGAGFGKTENVLAIGICAALAALAIQAMGARRHSLATGPATPALARSYQTSAALLLITAVCMAIARFV